MICSQIRRRQCNLAPTIYFVGALFVAAVSGCGSPTSGSEGGVRWQPESASAVVLVMESSTGSSQSLSDMRRELLSTPADADLAARFTGIALRRYASNGDPRLLGYAHGALAHWQNASAPPRAIWLLRGRLLQTQHRFREAAADLDTYSNIWPRDAEAITLSADAWRRAGLIANARSRCLALQFAGRSDLARLCAANIFLSLGDAERALQTADAALALASDSADESILVWGSSIRGDAAVAAGQLQEALAAYRTAIDAASDVPLALHLSYADTLIAAGEFAQANQYLALLPAADAVLLRRAINSKRLASDNLQSLKVQLQQRFSAADELLRDELHWRERALYALDVQEDVNAALHFARRNWEAQKGWEDAALLMRAATAAGDVSAADSVRQWRMEKSGDSA